MAPNILWICTDRQRWDTLGCMGNPHVKTPNLDRLAANGILFRNAFSQCPVCSPSRASFLTGRYPSTTRLNRNGQTIPSSERLISRLLADNDYICGHAGKMHLSASSPNSVQWSEKRIDDGYSVFDWSMHPPDVPICAYTAWLMEHDIEFKRTPVGDSKHITFGMPKETNNTTWIAQRAINFMKCNEPLDRPWFFTCDIEDPHAPYDPPQEFLQPYLDKLDEIELPHYTDGELENKPPFQMTDRHGVYGSGGGHFAAADMTDQEHRLIRAAYWAMIDHVDYQVGRMIEALEQSGQLDNTLILFMSDHGDMLGDHGMYMQGPYFYDEMVHVPLIMHYPDKIKAGLDSSAMVELTDISPTLMQAAGLDVYEGMQGKSFWPLMTGDADLQTHRDSVYHEYHQAIPPVVCHQKTGGAYITGVRNENYALSCVHNFDDGELYDLKKDPGMIQNLWHDPTRATERAQMLQLLCQRMAGTIDPLPPTTDSY